MNVSKQPLKKRQTTGYVREILDSDRDRTELGLCVLVINKISVILCCRSKMLHIAAWIFDSLFVLGSISIVHIS